MVLPKERPTNLIPFQSLFIFFFQFLRERGDVMKFHLNINFRPLYSHIRDPRLELGNGGGKWGKGNKNMNHYFQNTKFYSFFFQNFALILAF